MSTFDRRRIGGPEESQPLRYDHDASPTPKVLKTGLTTQANGSGYIESGGVKIACSVYGPRPKAPPYSPEGTLNLEIKFAPFASEPRRAPLRDTEPLSLSTLLSQMLAPALHLHLLPKSSIDVFLLVLESDTPANVLAAGLTVASAAVADAGIAMSALGVGVSDQGEKARMTLGSLPAIGAVTNVYMQGEMDVEAACSVLEASAIEAKSVHAILAASLLEAQA